MGLLEPIKYGEQFHKLYVSSCDKRTTADRSINRKKKPDKRKTTKQNDPTASLSHSDQIELEPNASKFAIFSAVRSFVLESETKSSQIYGVPQDVTGKRSPVSCCCICATTCKAGVTVECRCHNGQTKSQDNNDSENDSFTEDTTEKEIVLQVPQIVGAGLRGLFELIAEARNVSPMLCTKALRALFDVIQGQIPESFKSEPNDLIQPLYDLLLELSTLPGTAAQSSEVTNWSAIGCSALLGLCVARGDTGKTLKAIAALLMSPKVLATQSIQLPLVLSTLQRSIYSVALGKPTKPDYYKSGIPRNSLIEQFSLKNQLPANIQYSLQPCIASNGKFVFILTGKSLIKIGTGFNGTLRGYVYAVNNEFGREKNGWIGFCGNNLFYKKLSKRSVEAMMIINTETLQIAYASEVMLPMAREGQHSLLFSDGDSINVISTAKDDALVVKQIYTTGATVSDLPLKLSRKSFRTLGYASFEDEVLNQNQIQAIQATFNQFEPKLPNDQDVVAITCGKEFGLVRSANGKVYHYGKSAQLGLKSVGKNPVLRMTELIISKMSNIVQISIGHDGVHAILVNDDGTVYFAGTARRGEDGDTSKNRRAPKPAKPKKLTKVESHFVVHASCNNGTSAFVTKTGRLIIFGKDNAHCDSTGVVTGLVDEHITQVALGKAHCVALNSKGEVFTFGLNNKGQCGRQKQECATPLPTDGYETKPQPTVYKYDASNICDYDDHIVVQGQCRVCSICRECTGYNISCVSTQNTTLEHRLPGANCACGHGDAGCSKCGACSTCIAFQENECSQDGKDKRPFNFLIRQRSKSLISNQKDKKQDDINLGSDVERDGQRVAPLPPQKLSFSTTHPVTQISCGLYHSVVLTSAGEVFTFGSNQYGQLGTGDLQPQTGPYGPVTVAGVVCQVTAGSNHTALLTTKGIVYTFGNNQKGQLGRLPADSVQQTSNYPEDLSSKSDDGNEESSHSSNIGSQRQKYLWHCSPGAVYGIGPTYGKKATFISASGDQTFFKIDESLVTSSMLSKVNIVADKNTILLIPQYLLSFNCLAICRRDGNCNAHNANQVEFAKIIQTNNNAITQLASDKCNQNVEINNFHQNQDRMSQSVHEARNQIFDENMIFGDQRKRKRPEQKSIDKIMPQLAFALDSYFGVLWVFDAISRKIMCYNVIASEIIDSEGQSNLRAILSPELALPLKPEIQVTRNQASLNILACLDILTSCQDSIPACFQQIRPRSLTSPTKESESSDFQAVSRFENFGGGWGYSGHSVEAIRFMADSDIQICGFAMFGGRGEYTCKLKLFDLGCDGGGYEKDGVLISETEEIPYECPARSKYNIMLPKPLTGNAGKWYLVWARISGPSSDCGSSGQSTVTTEDQIVFNFKTSKKANNGTDVNSGQIPSILYRIITQETKQPPIPVDLDPVYKISRLFANTVTKECFESLVSLLSWAWSSFKTTLTELKDKKKLPQTTATLSRLFYINRACLRLLRKYTNEIYPNNVFAKVDKAQAAPANKKSETQIYVLNQGPSTSKNVPATKYYMGSSMDATTPTNPKKINMENLQLAECIGDVRSLLIQILSDEIPSDVDLDGYEITMEILDECHTTFLSCFNVFYPTSNLKWNCLCELLAQEEKGNYHSRLLSAIIAGLCHPNVKLRSTFSLLSSNRESKSIVSPSDNSGLPMLLSTENHQYPVLVEQMIYRTQREKSEFLTNVWTFKDVLVRLLDIISHPIKSKIENIYNRSNQYVISFNKRINQKLIDNCCHLLARVLAEIVYQSCASDNELSFPPTRTLLCTSSRFARCDSSRTWNTGNFGPDAISFSVNRSGIAIAGAMIYSGSGSYEYQLELLYDAIESQSQHKWETIESVSGTYDQEIVHNEMAEVKFERPVHIKENTRYAIRLCSQGARTCSGDGGLSTVRGPCGTTFSYFPCDLSFNGTTTARGQIPCLIYYTNPVKNEAQSGKALNELHARDTALQIASDITKKCTELLILTRNTLAASMSPSEKSLNSSNNTQTIDSEQNITPIEEHLDVTFANNSNITNTPSSFTDQHNVSTARDLSKRIESFSKGIMETLKFDKRSTNPFEFEIEIGATEIHPKDLVKESEIQDKNLKNGRISKMNGNNSNIKNLLNEVGRSGSEDDSSDFNVLQTLKLFENKSASMFHTLLPLVLAHISVLASNDPKSAVQILSLIRDILPHVSALNQLYCSKDKIIDPKDCIMQESRKENFFAKDLEEAKQHLLDLNSTSNHYCIIESDHPYKSASISNYKVEFPPCVQWFTVEFDHQCGTAQPEDYLVVSIPTKPSSNLTVNWDSNKQSMFSDGSKGLFDSYHSDKFSICKNACISSYTSLKDSDNFKSTNTQELSDDRFVVKVYNTTCQWSQSALVLPGNKIEFSLETASNYARDQLANKYGFRCLIIGYENPTLFPYTNTSLTKLECELAYLGGMCTSHLMKRDLALPGDNPSEDFSNVEETIAAHAALLSKGLAISDSVFTVNQALDSYLPIGGQSNEKQFLKDFVSAAPGSSGARLAAWLQPEPRLDPNKCELKPIQEPVRYGWPTQLSIICRDQYGDAVYIPDLKIEIKATPSGGVINGGRKPIMKNKSIDLTVRGATGPPKIAYEPTIKDKMCFNAITFMKPFLHYSFEELRFYNPNQTRVTETLYAHAMSDWTFGAVWTPSSVGNFCLTISIDGIALEEVYRVDVKEAGIPPPPHKPCIKKTQPPNKLRKFVSSNSAGLRIRSHPTLQSEQVGIVEMDGIISFIDEVENDDGVWVRLSTESIRQHCTTGWYPPEAWCLQYNQHLGKTLLHPVIEPQAKIMLARIRNSSQSSLDVNELTIDSDDITAPVGSPMKKFIPILGPNSFVFAQTAATSSFPIDSSESTDQHETKSDDDSKTYDDQTERIDDYSSAIGFIQTSSSSRDDDDKRSTQTGGSNMRNNSSGSSLSISPNQSNIGNTLAGVVGGGASKLQALHKWFKGDSFDGKDFSKKRNELSEFASVSVRDLVKAIGGPVSNGNESVAPHQSRSSSPVAVPIGRFDQLPTHGGSCSKSVEISDTSILVSTLVKDDLSQSPSQSSFRDEAEPEPDTYSFVDSHSSQTDERTAQTVRTVNFANTPKYSPRKMRNKRSVQGYFCNNPASADTKENDQHAGKINFNSEQKNSLRDHNNDINNSVNADMGRTIKRALPSSLAESLRAVFAAFLWHEGIVHDAMACSSFLKFHPTLPKNGAFIKNPGLDAAGDQVSLSKEQRAQQRYSVEVANAGNYLNIRPSTLETLTKSGNSSVHNRRFRKNGTEEQPKLHALPELMIVCPPALKCLVYLWDQLSSNCIQVVQSAASDLLKDIHNPHVMLNHRNDQNICDDSKKNKKKKKEECTYCELCDMYIPIPVTYHMRSVHPGCGKPAKGKGYNAVGAFCEGWAGNCGEGGKGASSWYLMCERCREKYLVRFININNINNTTNNIQTYSSTNKLENLFSLHCNMILNSEVYSMMKENSLFLLELSSTGSGGIMNNQKRSPQQMPVVTETQLHQIASDLNKPSTSRGDINSSVRNSKVILAYNCSRDAAGKGPVSSTPYRRSDIPSCVSPELLWQAPDTFSCLESLGASATNDTPYTIFGLNSTDNGFERPLSEISIDSMDRSGVLTNSITNTNSLSRFHRSMSMGQGWPNQSITSKYMQGNDNVSGQNSKVILRRRNNSTCDDGGSLLLCHPSENLRKLVPESVFQVSSNVTTQNKIKTDVSLEPPENEQVIPNHVTNAKTKNSSFVRNENVPSSSADANRRTNRSERNSGTPYKSNNIDQNVCLLSRPSMVFIMEQHNLDKLRNSLKRSLRVATARIYSLQALNWLMRSVTQTSCLHDLMWWFVSSLKPAVLDDSSKNDETEQALEHPISSTQMCGKISLLLTQSFHTYLQTVADLTLLLPPGSSLQQIAIQCFGIKFRQADHQFLHRSHVFGNISKILSRSDEQNEEMLLLSSAAMLESNPNFWIPHLSVNHETRVSNLMDLAGMFEITVSSRQTMVGSLTDGSTETFWESDEEDRNKAKIIEISMNKLSFVCKMIFVHIDNSRDIQNKVTNVSFYAGPSLGDTVLVKSVEVDSKAGTWISTNLRDDSWTHFRLEFRGSESTLRVRQIKILGLPTSLEEVHQRHNKLTNAFQIQQRNCEAETLRVFRLITAQVFGKLILGTEHQTENVNLTANAGMESSATSLLADSLDLREHMVGILFSRSKLSHLQKQVIVHIVHAIRKETQRAKEEWEILNATTNVNNVPLGNVDEKSDSSSENSRAPDTYCFEMLSMVLALSGSTVGRSYLSHQYSLLKDLLSLLHTGSDRVQRQVTLLLRRILPEITPDNLADILGIRVMPPNDFSIVNQSSHAFDMNRLGIIDIFLAVIAKALQLQIKIKNVTAPMANKQITTVKLCNCIDLNVYSLRSGEQNIDEVTEHLFDFGIGENSSLRNLNDGHFGNKDEKNLNQLWFMKGSISVKQAENIIGIIRDMAGGKFSDKWSLVTKAAIAESILNLTRLEEVFRTNENCIKTATLWLALASLCVLDKDHVERLSSGQWSKSSETRPHCSNHDDGITPAVIQCEVCGSLCGDCDRFLHLNRKTRTHHRTLCKEEEEAIRVELHESCGRTKLFWLLALADSKTLKAMVEFRDGNNAIISGPSSSIGRCRFCGVTGNSGLLAIGNVCANAECQVHAANTCTRSKPCGHSCGGVINEAKCLPCLQTMCNDGEPLPGPKLTQDADDMCMICFVEALSCAPAIQLDCGHVFHYHCCKEVLQKGWSGPRITFGFSQCPICKIDITHTLLNEVLEPIISLKTDVRRKAMMRLEYEGIMKSTDHRDLTQYAMDRYAYYVCFKCKKAYYGGEARCDAEMGDKFDPEELVCGGCSDVARAQMCPKHGTDFLEYKCRYCCSVAVFFCFGTTHFCDTCHDDFQRLTNIVKSKLPRCPAGPKAKQLLGEDCPLHVVHPPTGEEFALGCGICRNAHTF